MTGEGKFRFLIGIGMEGGSHTPALWSFLPVSMPK
jgi:hypothetical protein